MIALLQRLWIWLTYWKVPCEGCFGTGICAARHPTGLDASGALRTPTGERVYLSGDHPHSCCGDCRRINVPLDSVPDNWNGWREPSYRYDGTDGYDIKRYPHHARPMIGDGVMYRRPWAREQVHPDDVNPRRSRT